MQSDVLADWKHVLLTKYCVQHANLHGEHGKSLLFSSGAVNQHRLEFGLHADYVQHDPVRSEKNHPHDRPRLCRPYLSIFSANYYNCCLSFHHLHSHLLLRAHDAKGMICHFKAAVIL